MTGRRINRRHALCCTGALAAGLFTSLGTSAGNDGDGGGSAWRWANPCRGALPRELAQHELVLGAFEGLDASRLVDVHAHLLGTGDSGSGCTVHESMAQWWRPLEVLRKKAILNAACVDDGAATSIDRQYVQRLHELAQGFPPGARWWLFAFAHAADDSGRERTDWSTFHVPDAYAAEVAAAHRARFDWVASIHPYRDDALARLQQAIERGARAVKWLPSAMNIDPESPRCRPFYDALARARLPLIIHCGEEAAAPGARQDAFGNPLKVRAPLAAGVPVIVAHAASLGHALDTDKPSAPKAWAFDLFARVMHEQRGSPLLMADLSAVFQRNRRPDVWRRIVAEEAWHGRLLHGSDHPLPGVMPLFAPAKIVDAGLLDARDVTVLARVREHNPLLFDFVLKRRLKLGSVRLPASIFEGAALRAIAAPPPQPSASAAKIVRSI